MAAQMATGTEHLEIARLFVAQVHVRRMVDLQALKAAALLTLEVGTFHSVAPPLFPSRGAEKREVVRPRLLESARPPALVGRVIPQPELP